MNPPLELHPHEYITLVLHRHWFVLVRELAPLVLVFGVGLLMTLWYNTALVWFLFSLLLLVILALLITIWLTYYLDVWIVTSKRIIDIEQKWFFHREVSEYFIARVQDVTTEHRGLFGTTLDFGDLIIQTAGERNFVVRDAPHLDKAKQLILRCSENARKEEGHQSP